MTKHKNYLGTYTVGFADVGDSGMPGSGASRIRCTIAIGKTGRWIATGSYSTGCNQGYYQENYSYGPWEGRGDSADEAIASMLRRCPEEYRGDIRNASHDAKIDAEEMFGEDWREQSWAAIGAQVQRRLFNQVFASTHASSKKKYLADGVEADDVDQWRLDELCRLEGKLGSNSSPLSEVSDEAILAEVERRGLLAK